MLCRSDYFLVCRGAPAWKRLIDRPHATDKRISLITDLFSNGDETEAVKCLCGDDAQSFIDVIDEVLLLSFQQNRTANLSPNFPIPTVDNG